MNSISAKILLGDWKKGTIPVRSTQQLLAKYFGVSVDYLMGKTNNPIPNTETVGTYIPYEKRGLRPPLDAYPNPTLCGVRSLSKPQDTPCLKTRGVFFCLGDKGE